MTHRENWVREGSSLDCGENPEPFGDDLRNLGLGKLVRHNSVARES